MAIGKLATGDINVSHVVYYVSWIFNVINIEHSKIAINNVSKLT